LLRVEYVGLPGCHSAPRGLDEAVPTGGAGQAPYTGGLTMAATRQIQGRAIAVLVTAYVIGLLAYPNLPGPFLDEKISARIMVAFTLPTTALVIYALFRSLWRHDRIRSGNGAFEATYHAIVLRVLLFVLALQHHQQMARAVVGQVTPPEGGAGRFACRDGAGGAVVAPEPPKQAVAR